jgi:hypothetical protein
VEAFTKLLAMIQGSCHGDRVAVDYRCFAEGADMRAVRGQPGIIANQQDRSTLNCGHQQLGEQSSLGLCWQVVLKYLKYPKASL